MWIFWPIEPAAGYTASHRFGVYARHQIVAIVLLVASGTYRHTSHVWKDRLRTGRAPQSWP